MRGVDYVMPAFALYNERSRMPSTFAVSSDQWCFLLRQTSCAFVLLILEPPDIGGRIRKPFQAGLSNRRVRYLLQRRVPGMMRFLVRIVASGVITADHGPAGILRSVLVRAV